MDKPDYTHPPQHYQVMTIGQARNKFPEDSTFTTKDFCKTFGIKDDHWCYTRQSRGVKKSDPRQRPSVVPMRLNDPDGSKPFDTYTDACRHAWISFLRWEVLDPEISDAEADRIVGRFQKGGSL